MYVNKLDMQNVILHTTFLVHLNQTYRQPSTRQVMRYVRGCR